MSNANAAILSDTPALAPSQETPKKPGLRDKLQRHKRPLSLVAGIGAGIGAAASALVGLLATEQGQSFVQGTWTAAGKSWQALLLVIAVFAFLTILRALGVFTAANTQLHHHLEATLEAQTLNAGEQRAERSFLLQQLQAVTEQQRQLMLQQAETIKGVLDSQRAIQVSQKAIQDGQEATVCLLERLFDRTKPGFPPPADTSLIADGRG